MTYSEFEARWKPAGGAERAELGLSPEKRRKGHAERGTTKWVQMRQTARQQALGYVRALQADEPRSLFVPLAESLYKAKRLIR